MWIESLAACRWARGDSANCSLVNSISVTACVVSLIMNTRLVAASQTLPPSPSLPRQFLWNKHESGTMHCIALHCIALHCIALHCIALHCIALHCIALQCSAVQCSAVQCSAVQCSAVQCSAVQCSAVQCNTEYNTTKNSTIQYNTIQYSKAQHSTIKLYYPKSDINLQCSLNTSIKY